LARALDYTRDDPRDQQLRDVSAVQAGRIPQDVLEDEELMQEMPVLLRTMKERRRDGVEVERLLQLIRSA
jgi:hypothetical protein